MPLKIVDSSTLPLNLTNYRWAKFRNTKAGVKLGIYSLALNGKNINLKVSVSIMQH
jgi:hypothetical protein